MKRALIIDDNALLLRMVARGLSARFAVTRCSGLHEALGLFAAGEVFDVILCDMSLDDGTGQEFYERLRERSIEQSDRVLFYSGGDHANGEHAESSFFQATQGRHLLKPLAATALMAQLAAMVASSCPTVRYFEHFRSMTPPGPLPTPHRS